MDQKNCKSSEQEKINAIFDRYIDKKTRIQASQFKPLTFWIVFYLIVLSLQFFGDFPAYFKGILAQICVIISVYLALSYARKGFWAGLILNSLNISAVLIYVLLTHNTVAVTGVIVALFTIASISIIAMLVSRNARQLSAVVKQKEELLELSENLAASEEELRNQNEQLLEYYQIIKSNEEKLNHLAYFDTLTELPNRKMILDRLELLANFSKIMDSFFAVVFIDLDDFKKINDTMGHYVGDLLIVAVASRLNSLVHKGDVLGRLGGDEFALIIQQDMRDEAILQYVEQLRESLDEKFNIDRYEFKIKASFGISIFPQDGNTPIELIRCADTAMYKAKETGKDGIYFFRKEMQEEILRRMEFETKMIAALQNSEYFLVFQPQYMVDTTCLRGFEALVRWQSPDYGLLNPMEFIPIAEETGFIVRLGEWILKTACHKFKELMERYRLEAVISVNISALQFDDLTFVPTLKRILSESALPPQNLELEITESVLIKSLDRTIKTLNELKDLGIKISLDDFGTGYSSLRYLQLLPIDTLKVDRSFVTNIDDQNGNRQITGSIISLVHQMNIFVVAEGVESETQLNYLREEGCDGVQGFLLGKPQTFAEVEKILDEYRGVPKKDVIESSG